MSEEELAHEANRLEELLRELKVEERRYRRREEFGEVERVSTGVEDLDRALEGGIPKGAWVVITGEPGTGKSILCMHFAWAGLTRGEPVVYVTTEAEFRDVVKQAKQFNMDFDSYSVYNLGSSKEPSTTPQIVVIDIFGLLKTARQLSQQEVLSGEEVKRRRYAALEIPTLVAAIHEAYKILGLVSEKSKTPRKHVRLIIDSMSAFWADKPAMARKYSYELKIATHRDNVTAYLTSQYAMTTQSLDGREPIVIRFNGERIVTEIGKFIDNLMNRFRSQVLYLGESEVLDVSDLGLEVLGVDQNLTLHWYRVHKVIRHKPMDVLIEASLSNGAELLITGSHSIYKLENDSLKLVDARNLRKGDELLGLGSDLEKADEGLRLRPLSIKNVEIIEKKVRYVYDISVSPYENFIAGYSGILVHNSTFGFGLEHIADGVIHLWMDNPERTREIRRYLIIKKMRMTNHARKAFRLEIIPGKGVVLEPLD